MSDGNHQVSNEEKERLSLIESFSDGKRLFKITAENFRNPNCIDGRDDDNQRPSIPGGVIGALGVVLAGLDKLGKEYNRTNIVNRVKKYFGEGFSGHTESNKNGGHQCQGCGHMARLTDQGEKYFLSHESSIILENEANNLSKDKIVILEGSHEEINAIVVNAPGYGVKSNHNGRQDFVYNISYANELYKELSNEVSKEIQISSIELHDLFNEMAQNHLMRTAGDLAKNKNAYLINDINKDGIPEISFYTQIPANPE